MGEADAHYVQLTIGTVHVGTVRERRNEQPKLR